MDRAFDIALAHFDAGRYGNAQNVYRDLLSRQPNHPDAWHMLGLIEHRQNHHQAAVEFIQKAIALDPKVASYYSNLSLALLALGRAADAIAACRQALAIAPDFYPAYINLSLALLGAGRLHEAIAACRRAVELQPNRPDIRARLAGLLGEANRLDEAIALCRQTLAAAPRDADSFCVLGAAFGKKGDLGAAIEALQHAIALRPGFFDAYNNLGRVLKDSALIQEAVDAYRKAAALMPFNPSPHGSLLYTLYFHPRYTIQAIYAEHQRFNEIHARPLEKQIQPHSNDRSPNRRLRIGYFCVDFRAHSSSFFTLPLFASHDRSRVEVICYADVLAPDEITDRIKAHADTWRHVAGMQDAQLATLIRQDRIDILVDLTMHMGGGRPLLFARKPAPVQVAWLAYPGTTGLTAMDYRITDPYLDPPGMNDDFYSEKSIRLPDTFWCYQPLTDGPAVGPLPSAGGGPITFGCFNNFCKVTEITVQLWAAVMRSIPGSRVIVQAGAGSFRERLGQQLQSLGVAADRLAFVDRMPVEPYLALYHNVDIVLDTFPYNGHTTSLDSLWMGVPIVTLCGRTAVSRAGLSLMSNLGLTDLVAYSPRKYVEIAMRLATDKPRLIDLRSTLRSRLEKSPLMDSKRFAGNMETAFRAMWLNALSAHP